MHYFGVPDEPPTIFIEINTLNGDTGTRDSFTGEVKNFQTLKKAGAGSWTLTGSIGDNGGNDPLIVLVNSGVLNLTGNNANFNGSIIVNPGPDVLTPGANPRATLAAAAQSLPPLITDHGIVLFNQTEDGT
jgi:fibronectin-binding autotransporter adhesin